MVTFIINIIKDQLYYLNRNDIIPMHAVCIYMYDFYDIIQIEFSIKKITHFHYLFLKTVSLQNI